MSARNITSKVPGREWNEMFSFFWRAAEMDPILEQIGQCHP